MSFSTPPLDWLFCVGAMTDAVEGRTFSAKEGPTEIAEDADQVPASPTPASSEPSSARGSASSCLNEQTQISLHKLVRVFCGGSKEKAEVDWPLPSASISMARFAIVPLKMKRFIFTSTDSR